MADEGVTLITGASSGIGLETARMLVQKNVRVFGTRLSHETFAEPGLEVLELDVNLDSSVSACVAEVVKRAGRLDVLVNNAGAGFVGMVEETSIEEARALFETNYFGTVRMIRAALPIMRAQGSGLIINVSSVAGNIGVPYEAHYCASKLAIASLTRALRWELAAFGVQVVVVSPGCVRTPFYAVLGKPAAPLTDYDGVRRSALACFEKAIRGGCDARTIARTIVKVIKSKSPAAQHWAGSDARVYGLAHRFLPNYVVDWVMRSKFRPRPAGAGAARG